MKARLQLRRIIYTFSNALPIPSAYSLDLRQKAIAALVPRR
ncbi:hypothetical protein [Halomicronema sp. CCY15110]|nr:hypothetical protein [Halomicronema sp. CCY15110]